MHLHFGPGVPIVMLSKVWGPNSLDALGLPRRFSPACMLRDERRQREEIAELSPMLMIERNQSIYLFEGTWKGPSPRRGQYRASARERGIIHLAVYQSNRRWYARVRSDVLRREIWRHRRRHTRTLLLHAREGPWT